MKTKIILSGLLVLVIISCTSTKYFLPSSETINVNQYGSYINITHKRSVNIMGELISIDSSRIVVLMESTHKCVSVSISDVQRFKLQYANPKRYGWSIPAYTLATISHGVFLIFTAPINLIVTISVTSGGESAFTYSDKDMTYDKLKMFARFPQGIPANIDLASIK